MFCENLLEQIEKYVNSGKSTEYAVLLHGEWGCGKTYFCRGLEEKWSSDLVWYISVFGVAGKAELDEKIFEASHPIISSNSGKTITKLGYNISKVVLKSKFNVDISAIVDGISDKLKNIDELQCKLLIVDDVERSKMDLEELLGYFSSYLYDGLKIIFVANENEILNKKMEGYSKYKEKMIGENYEIIPDLPKAVEEFNKVFGLSDEYVKFVVESCEKLRIKNLRLVKQVLYQWNIFFDRLDDTYKKDKEFLFVLYKTYFVLKIQYKLSIDLFILTNVDEIQRRKKFNTRCKEAWIAFRQYDMSLERYRDCINDEKSEIAKSRTMDLIMNRLVIEDLWYEILVSGKEIDKTWMNNIINSIYVEKTKESKIKNEENTALRYINKLLFIDHLDYRKEYNLKSELETLCEEFRDGKYTELGECITFIRIYIYLVMEEIVPKNEYTDEKLNDILDDYIAKFHDSIRVDEGYDHDNFRLPQLSGNEMVQTRIKQLYEIVNKRNEAEKNSVFHECEKFFSLICNPINALNKYLGTPIMKQLDIDELFSWLDVNENIDYNNKLLTFLQYRYGYGISNRGIGKVDFIDYDSVMQLKDKYKNAYEKMRFTYSLKIKHYKYYVVRYEDLLKYMDASMKEYNKIFETGDSK